MDAGPGPRTVREGPAHTEILEEKQDEGRRPERRERTTECAAAAKVRRGRIYMYITAHNQIEYISGSGERAAAAKVRRWRIYMYGTAHNQIE